MTILRKVKRFSYLLPGIFFAMLFFYSCEQLNVNPSRTDRQWMDAFFKDLMLEEGAIYTLLGSKPMTRIIFYEYSEEQIKQYVDSLSEEEIKNARIIKHYTLPDHWKKWEAVKHLFPSRRFLLFQAMWQHKPEVKFIYFVDIIKTAMTIQENYNEFKIAYGQDFNPLEKVLEITEPDTEFWKKIANHYALWGLLFGYGKENAFLFSWKYEKGIDKVVHFLDRLSCLTLEEGLIGSEKRTLKNLEIPAFISFRKDDPIVEKYQQEREAIRKYCSERDFLDAILERFMEE